MSGCRCTKALGSEGGVMMGGGRLMVGAEGLLAGGAGSLWSRRGSLLHELHVCK